MISLISIRLIAVINLLVSFRENSTQLKLSYWIKTTLDRYVFDSFPENPEKSIYQKNQIMNDT